MKKLFIDSVCFIGLVSAIIATVAAIALVVAPQPTTIYIAMLSCGFFVANDMFIKLHNHRAHQFAIENYRYSLA